MAQKSNRQIGVVAKSRPPLIVMVISLDPLPEYMTIQEAVKVSGLPQKYIRKCQEGQAGFPKLPAVTLPGYKYSHIRRADYEQWMEQVRKESTPAIPGKLRGGRFNGKADVAPNTK